MAHLAIDQGNDHLEDSGYATGADTGGVKQSTPTGSKTAVVASAVTRDLSCQSASKGELNDAERRGPTYWRKTN